MYRFIPAYNIRDKLEGYFLSLNIALFFANLVSLLIKISMNLHTSLLSDERFEGNVIVTGSRVTETKEGQNINFYLFEYRFAYICAFLSNETVHYVVYEHGLNSCSGPYRTGKSGSDLIFVSSYRCICTYLYLFLMHVYVYLYDTHNFSAYNIITCMWKMLVMLLNYVIKV